MFDGLRLRTATASDVPALAALYADTARRLGPRHYTPAQVGAWASFAEDETGFRAYVLQPRTWLLEADADGAPVAFCGIQPDGEVRSLYVAADRVGQGLGSRLLAHVLDDAARQGVRRLQAWATPFSRPVFERHGFTLQRVVPETFQGVMFDRLRMARG